MRHVTEKSDLDLTHVIAALHLSAHHLNYVPQLRQSQLVIFGLALGLMNKVETYKLPLKGSFSIALYKSDLVMVTVRVQVHFVIPYKSM